MRKISIILPPLSLRKEMEKITFQSPKDIDISHTLTLCNNKLVVHILISNIEN